MPKNPLQNTLHSTVYASLLVQIVTGIIDIYVIQLPIAPDLAILKKLLGVEIAVQVVEGIFYVWFASTFAHIENVTPSRYYDWAITTPSMLFTFCIYLDFINHRNSNVVEKKTDIEQPDHQEADEKARPRYTTSLIESFQKNKTTLIPILLLNWMMLFFGYLGEINVLPTMLSVALGFIPFLLYFAMIYVQYAKYTVTGRALFWVFAAIWSLYGISAMLSYYWKNIGYNVLDLFAKNFFGVFLAYVVYQQYHIVA
jgi:hypothetical protein